MSAVWRRSALALVLSGCSAVGSMDGPNGPRGNAGDGDADPTDGRDGSGEIIGDGDGDGAPGCDIAKVFAEPENGCTNAGCHGAQYQGNLDLLSPGLAERLVGHVSSTDACGGERLVDPEHPDDSLLLRLIDPARFAAKPCGVMMPLGSEGTSPETIACVESWISSLSPGQPPDPEPSYEAVAADSYVNKVKTLLTGKAATAAEIAEVEADPDALEALATSWVGTPEFEAKLTEFLAVALQQRIGVSLNAQFMGLRGSKLNRFRENLEESFVRTALAIVKEGRPFTDILTTRKWVVSTAVLVALTYLDLTREQLAAQRHTVIRGPGQDSVQNRVWHVASMPNTCTPRSPIPGFQMLELVMGFSVCQEPGVNYRFDDSLLTDADFTDFRTVELVKVNAPASVPNFYDLASLRRATKVELMVPRVGFFTSPAFLINWETNEDNQFRVTTSQTLIVALGSIFSAADSTTPVRLDGLAREHAEPGSTCFGCHRHLDPMRMYFAKNFSYEYQRTPSPTQVNPSFAFEGTTEDGGGLQDFAETLARHPAFATGWTQKLCYWANSQACNEKDPEFERIAALFVDSGYDLKKMIAALVSSPLVTFAAESGVSPPAEAIVSITRKQHLCQLLDARLGTTDTCAVAANFAGLIPEDAFSRGAAEPVQSAVTGLFHYAAAEKLCMRLSARLVGTGAGFRFDVGAPEAALDSMVADLMGLGMGHARAEATRAKLAAHYEAAKSQTNAQVALRSAFTVSCMSPEVMAVGL